MSQEPGDDQSRQLTQRVEELGHQVTALATAVRALAEGLAPSPIEDQPPIETAQEGARLARDLLLSAGL